MAGVLRHILLHGLLIVAVLLTACRTSTSQELQVEDLSRRAAFIEHCKNTNAWQKSAFANRAGENRKSPQRLRKTSYSELTSYYRRMLQAFASNYPNDVLRLSPKTALQSFNGQMRLEVPEVHVVPFIPISPLAFDERSLEFRKIQTEFEGTTIYGLEVSAEISERYKNLPSGDKIDELYIPDVNAREMGFTHAQLVPELSRNVQPSHFFEYNDLLDWKHHQRYQRHDQISRPLRLTNFAHSNGSSYAISAHPDFSLSLPKAISEGATMTFFLWRADEKDEALPDFVFRFLYRGK